MPPEDAFQGSTKWFRIKYEITEQEGVQVISAQSGSEVEWFDPLTFFVPSRRPRGEYEQVEFSPHTALARLNCKNENEILDFVNQWGLLGLWRVPDYQEADTLKHKDKNIFSKEKPSIWFHHPHKTKQHRWQEPLKIFIEAAEEYQKLFSEIEYLSDIGEEEKSKAILSITFKLNSQLNGIRPGISWNEKGEQFAIWQFSSLYAAIHLQTYLNLLEGRFFRRCKHKKCRRFFVTTHPENQYCSDFCRTSYLVQSHRIRQWKSELLHQFLIPGVDRIWLEEQIDLLLKQPGVGPKKAAQKLKSLINEKGEL